MRLSVTSSKARLYSVGNAYNAGYCSFGTKAFLVRGFEHLKLRSLQVPRWDIVMLLFAVSNVSIFGKRDQYSCSTLATIIILSTVSITDSLLSTRHASANHILRCDANAYSICSGYVGSLPFFFAGCYPRSSRHASTFARACTPLTKSGERERLLTVYQNDYLCTWNFIFVAFFAYNGICRALFIMVYLYNNSKIIIIIIIIVIIHNGT